LEKHLQDRIVPWNSNLEKNTGLDIFSLKLEFAHHDPYRGVRSGHKAFGMEKNKECTYQTIQQPQD